MSDFPKHLRRIRKEKGISQVKLAEILNFGCTAISSYESGRNEPSFDTLICIAQFLNVTSDELLGIEKKPDYWDDFIAFRRLKRRHQLLVRELIKNFSD